jgi:hypothetical protein
VTGEKDLDMLLSSLAPQLLPGEYVYCTLANAHYGDYAELEPLASFAEQEGLTLVLPRQSAEDAGLGYGTVYRCITLGVHSSLDAVGLTAAVAAQLAQCGISANVIAAYYHDHILVPANRVAQAMTALESIDG